MIKSKKNRLGYTNEITEYLDRYLIKCDGCIASYSNYIYPIPLGDTWTIRVPGASRGSIEVIEGRIKNITLHEERFCYERDVLNNLKQFIGKKIDLCT